MNAVQLKDGIEMYESLNEALRFRAVCLKTELAEAFSADDLNTMTGLELIVRLAPKGVRFAYILAKSKRKGYDRAEK